jgi:hypothetical protein
MSQEALFVEHAHASLGMAISRPKPVALDGANKRHPAFPRVIAGVSEKLYNLGCLSYRLVLNFLGEPPHVED